MLTDFIRAWRERAAAKVSTRAFVPLKFELGEAFQFDWSEERLVVVGIWRKLQLAHLKLCAMPIRAAFRRWGVSRVVASTTT